MQNITSQFDYDVIVAELGQAAIEVYNDSSFEEDLCNAAFEVVDGSQYIIYTRYHADILTFASNPNEGLEQGLVDFSELKDIHWITQQAAFWALQADVIEWAHNNNETEE
jgi:hypothetical protein